MDEIGYLPITPGGDNLFFQLVNNRYEKGAMILTLNRCFAEWGEVFGDPLVATALLDRLLHHAIVIQIEGASYRLRAHADLMPEHTRSHATSCRHSRPSAAGGHRKTGGSITCTTDHRHPDLRNFTSALLGKPKSAFTAGSHPARGGQALRRAREESGVAEGLVLRHDHGSNCMSGDFQREIRVLGMTGSPAFVRQPEGNGVAERAIRTLKEQLLWVRHFATGEKLRLALAEFAALSNASWLRERHGHRTPDQIRAEQRTLETEAATGFKLAP